MALSCLATATRPSAATVVNAVAVEMLNEPVPEPPVPHEQWFSAYLPGSSVPIAVAAPIS